MPLILQLSDLHLGTSPAHEYFGDHKVPLIPEEERLGRNSLLRSSLRELGEWLRAEGLVLDAIVIAGDVTYQLNLDGYKALAPLLSELQGSIPDASKIMVVPGNHDVKRGTDPSSPERYDAFVKGIDALGYVRPYLEGVDITRQGQLTATTRAPIIEGADGDFTIVGLNSSNFSQIQLLPPEIVEVAVRKLEKSKHTKEVDLLIADWRDRGHFDMARIGGAQRRWASQALREANLTARPDDIEPIRIAVFHHQLLPVSLDEEVKPFDALVNLSEVRDWLAANQIDLLLHGHKHVPKIYEDRYLPEHEENPQERRVLVSSTATVGLGQGRNGEVGKLIKIDTTRPTLRRISIASVPARDHGVPLRELTYVTSDLGNPRVPNRPQVFEGNTTQEVHEQLLAALEGENPSGVLMCHIGEGSTAAKMPTSFPTIIKNPMTAEDFAELVEIWQAKQPLSSMRFNHGERISNFHEVDQLETAARALATNSDSSRAVMILLDPARDDLSSSDIDAPSFCLVQLVLDRGRLDVVGYFRKQEMRFWWPINVSELHHLQLEAVRKLGQMGTAASPGSITTVTAVPTAGQSVPRVAIPRIDRDSQRKPERILEMSLAVFGQPKGDNEDLIGYWRDLISDCTPPVDEAADGTPAATEGLSKLCETLDVLARVYGKSDLHRELTSTLKAIRLLNHDYLGDRRDGGGNAFAAWTKGLAPALDDLREQVDEIEERLKIAPAL
ncbi:MAG: hypothetical protein JWO18_2290 [Microbacteriaceae bacterium]|nr:hypothetical protein [Microbacteriaceae bacterium]